MTRDGMLLTRFMWTGSETASAPPCADASEKTRRQIERIHAHRYHRGCARGQINRKPKEDQGAAPIDAAIRAQQPAASPISATASQSITVSDCDRTSDHRTFARRLSCNPSATRNSQPIEDRYHDKPERRDRHHGHAASR